MITPRPPLASAGYHLAGRVFTRRELAGAGLALALAGLIPRPAWRIGRLAVTAVHEAGHAAVAVMTGRQVAAVHLRSDASGATYHRGPVRRLSQLPIAAAGYPAPTLVAVAGAWLTSRGDSRIWLGILVGLGVLNAVLWVRNLFGIAIVVAWVGAVGLLLNSGSAGVDALAGTVVVWYLAAGGVRSGVESLGDTRLGDAAELSRLSHLPTAFWKAGFVLLAAAGVAACVALLFGASGR